MTEIGPKMANKLTRKQPKLDQKWTKINIKMKLNKLKIDQNSPIN